MNATFFQKVCKSRLSIELARQYLPAMVDSKQVRIALRQMRTDKKMSPEEFADEAGINRATVYRIEDMEDAGYSPRIETVSALVNALGLTLSQFFLNIEGLRFVSPPRHDEDATSAQVSAGSDRAAASDNAGYQVSPSRGPTHPILNAIGKLLAEYVDERVSIAREQDRAPRDQKTANAQDH